MNSRSRACEARVLTTRRLWLSCILDDHWATIEQAWKQLAVHCPYLIQSPKPGASKKMQKRIAGEGGYRSLCLSHAKRALYHLSYIPVQSSTSTGTLVNAATLNRKHSLCTYHYQKNVLPYASSLEIPRRSEGRTGTRTRSFGFKVQGVNHYTIQPQVQNPRCNASVKTPCGDDGPETPTPSTKQRANYKK